MEIIRATKIAEQAGAYYVRIQAMARKHKIPLNLEFDEHDTPETKYIVLDGDAPADINSELFMMTTTRLPIFTLYRL